MIRRMPGDTDIRHTAHVLRITTHPADRRTVDDVRVMRIGSTGKGRYRVELRLRDRFAILSAPEAETLSRLLREAAHGGSGGIYWQTSQWCPPEDVTDA